MPLFPEHDRIFEVKVKQNDHLAIARLVESMLDVVVENVNLKKSDANFKTTYEALNYQALILGFECSTSKLRVNV